MCSFIYEIHTEVMFLDSIQGESREKHICSKSLSSYLAKLVYIFKNTSPTLFCVLKKDPELEFDTSLTALPYLFCKHILDGRGEMKEEHGSA